MTSIFEFVGGDDFIFPFVIEKTDGSILNLTGYTVSGVIFWRGRDRIDLATGSEIEISTLFPDDASTPHGYIRLPEEQTADFPRGATARLRLTTVLNGVTLSTVDCVLDRVDQEVP